MAYEWTEQTIAIEDTRPQQLAGRRFLLAMHGSPDAVAQMFDGM